MIFTGAKLDTGLYNELLFRYGERLLPCPLKSLVDGEIHGLFVEPVHPSPLEKLLELKTLRARAGLGPTDHDGGREGARKAKFACSPAGTTRARSPAVIERIVGEGRVLLWTTTADRAGNDWPIEPSFVLAVREAVQGTARPTSLANNVLAGERIRRVIHSSQQVANAKLTPPGGSEPQSLSAVPIEEPASDRGPAVEIKVADTRRAGLYRVTWEEGPLGEPAGSVRGESRPA